MALTGKSLFLYGFEVTRQNQALDFRVVAAETPRQATLTLGFYSLTGLMREIARAMQSQAILFDFFVTADRTYSGGTQNRVSITTTAPFLEILFASGPRSATDCHALIGFPDTDQIGATLYTGTTSAGTGLQPVWWGKNYLPTDNDQKVFGSVNVTASGIEEAIVWQIQEFTGVTFDYEPEARIATEWKPFNRWAIQKRPFEFTRSIDFPSVFDDVTLNQTSADGNGLGFKMTEMLPQFPFLYTTGPIKMRKRVVT